MLLIVAAGGFALALSGLARWIFVLVIAAAATAAWVEGRPAVQARAEAESLGVPKPRDPADDSRMTQLFSG